MPEGQLYFRPDRRRIYVEIPLRGYQGFDCINTIAFSHNFENKRKVDWSVSCDYIDGEEIIRIEDEDA